jgi:2-dehydropantoate 2-reductase
LAAAGHEVTFLMRSDVEAVRREGMELTLQDGRQVRLKRPTVVGEASRMGEQDVVLVAMKTTRNACLEALLKSCVGPETLLLTLQNGLGNAEHLQALYPRNKVLGGLCQIGVNREGPGRVRSFVPRDGFMQLGAHGDCLSQEALETLAGQFEAAGIHTKVASSLGEALWRKLMWNVPFNGLTVALGGKGTDTVVGDPALREVARGLMEEIRKAATALGFPIEPAYTDKLLGFTDQIGPYKASSVLDWQAGRGLEVEAIFRNPLEAGKRAGVAMPHLETLCALLEGLNRDRLTG